MPSKAHCTEKLISKLGSGDIQYLGRLHYTRRSLARPQASGVMLITCLNSAALTARRLHSLGRIMSRLLHPSPHPLAHETGSELLLASALPARRRVSTAPPIVSRAGLPPRAMCTVAPRGPLAPSPSPAPPSPRWSRGQLGPWMGHDLEAPYVLEEALAARAWRGEVVLATNAATLTAIPTLGLA